VSISQGRFRPALVARLGYNYGGGVKVKVTEMFMIRFDVRQYQNSKPFDLPKLKTVINAALRTAHAMRAVVSYQPLLAFGILALSGLMIKPVQSAITGLFAKKATAVMTNVPGPKEPLTFCGRSVKQMMFWVPQSGDIGMGVSILSYAGGVQFGLVTDARMCPDPEAIIERFAPEFEKLLWLALMAPWPSDR
jgi:hypothetical protein